MTNWTVPSNKAKLIAFWTLRILLGLALLAAGGSKLGGAPAMVAIFANLGIGQWFRYVVGLLEVIGAVGLFIPRYVRYGAILLAVVMFGAIIAHLAVLGTNPAAPIVLLVLLGAVLWVSKTVPEPTAQTE